MKQFYVFLGPKDTGKSFHNQLLELIMESFAGVVNDKVFKQGKAQSVHDTEAFSLMDKRLAFVSELGEDEHFNEQLIKKISGGDMVNVRACGSDKNIPVRFNCVLSLATNEIPKFKEEAFTGRMRILSFKRKFVKDEKRRVEILSKIDDFFTMFCMSAKRYYENNLGFVDVPEVLEATRKVIDDKDTFLSWVDEDEFVVDESYIGAVPTLNSKEPRAKKTGLYASYQSWCTANSAQPIGRNSFYERFSNKYQLPEYKQGKFWRGVRPKNTFDE